jgi:uncharacterized protein (TIGR02757 family)
MKIKQSSELKDLLERYYLEFHQKEFIEDDPISIPHRFSIKEDIEISGFLAAIIAWGQRKTIIRNANRMIEIMDNSPYDFILNHQESDRQKAVGFVHRTFNSDDLIYFFHALQQLYKYHGGLEVCLSPKANENMKEKFSHFKQLFFQPEHFQRTEKHIADPIKGSSAKRLNMYLRWMVRLDQAGVDFGIWKSLSPAQLSCPLDVHSGKVARKLGLLKRKQNDAKALAELDKNLRRLDPHDPVKYDFALFGLGVFEGF